MRYAQRICLEHKKFKSCVHVYTIMGLHEEAVSLALQDKMELEQILGAAKWIHKSTDFMICD